MNRKFIYTGPIRDLPSTSHQGVQFFFHLEDLGGQITRVCNIPADVKTDVGVTVERIRPAAEDLGRISEGQFDMLDKQVEDIVMEIPSWELSVKVAGKEVYRAHPGLIPVVPDNDFRIRAAINALVQKKVLDVPAQKSEVVPAPIVPKPDVKPDAEVEKKPAVESKAAVIPDKPKPKAPKKEKVKPLPPVDPKPHDPISADAPEWRDLATSVLKKFWLEDSQTFDGHLNKMRSKLKKAGLAAGDTSKYADLMKGPEKPEAEKKPE